MIMRANFCVTFYLLETFPVFRRREDALMWRLYHALPHSALEAHFCLHPANRWDPHTHTYSQPVKGLSHEMEIVENGMLVLRNELWKVLQKYIFLQNAGFSA